MVPEEPEELTYEQAQEQLDTRVKMRNDNLGVTFLMVSVINVVVLIFFALIFYGNTADTHNKAVRQQQRSNAFWEMVAGKEPIDGTDEGQFASDIRAHHVPSLNFSDRSENQKLEDVILPTNQYPNFGSDTNIGLNTLIWETVRDDASGKSGYKFKTAFINDVNYALQGDPISLLVKPGDLEQVHDANAPDFWKVLLVLWFLSSIGGYIGYSVTCKGDQETCLAEFCPPLEEPTIVKRYQFVTWQSHDPRDSGIMTAQAALFLPVYGVVKTWQFAENRLLFGKTQKALRGAQRIQNELERQNPYYDQLAMARELRRQLEQLPQTLAVQEQLAEASRLIQFYTEDPVNYSEEMANRRAAEIAVKLTLLHQDSTAILDAQREFDLRS